MRIDGHVVVMVAWLCLAPTEAAGQGGRTVVSYDVEFSVVGSLLDRNCKATGTDYLSGTLVGLEPALANEPNEYVGTLMRATNITTCGTRRTPAGQDVVCSIRYSGSGFPKVILTIDPGRDGYLQYLTDTLSWKALLRPHPALGPVHSTVTGTCDPVELSQLQADYDGGETAGSPNGQPIEVDDLPPTSIPATFPPNPPRSIWTLKVLARRP